MSNPTQNELMLFCPATGKKRPYPSHASQWRDFHGDTAWLFNPWTGQGRRAEDVGSDIFGFLIQPVDIYKLKAAVEGDSA